MGGRKVVNEVMGCTLIRYDLLSLQEEEIRVQTGTEGDQKGGCLPAEERGLRSPPDRDRRGDSPAWSGRRICDKSVLHPHPLVTRYSFHSSVGDARGDLERNKHSTTIHQPSLHSASRGHIGSQNFLHPLLWGWGSIGTT